MALIRCNECKARISDKATTCPKCGAPVITTPNAKKKNSGCGCLLALLIIGGAIALGIAVKDTPPSSVSSQPTAESRNNQQASNDYMVRVAVWDDTKSRPVHPKAEIWFQGVGSWWLQPEMKNGGTSKDLGTRPKGVEHALIIYPESRSGRELKVPYKMTSEMNPKGSPRDMIQVTISDTTVTVEGLPIKAATGQDEIKYPR